MSYNNNTTTTPASAVPQQKADDKNKPQEKGALPHTGSETKNPGEASKPAI